MRNKTMSKNILITGANGALAKKLIATFNQDSDYNVFAATRNIKNLSYRLDFVKYINNSDLIRTDILKDIDIIINSSFPRTQDVKLMYEATRFFECLVLKAIEMKVAGFINISSQSVYGSYREIPSKETDALLPEDIYALTKTSIETIGWALSQDTGLALTSLRLASLIGNEYPERVINKMINYGYQNKKIIVQNDKNVFGFMHIDDAVDGLYHFVKNSDLQKWKPIYNFGVRPEYSKNLAYIATIIRNLFSERTFDISLEITTKEKADKLQAMNSGCFYESAKWKPKITLKEAIEKIFLEM